MPKENMICIVWHLSNLLAEDLSAENAMPQMYVPDSVPRRWETVNNTKIILLCNAADRRSSTWQAFSSTSIWYIKQCTTELSASIIMQCCALKMPPSLHNYESTKAIWKESRAHPLSLTIFGCLNIWSERREFVCTLKISHIAVSFNIQREKFKRF